MAKFTNELAERICVLKAGCMPTHKIAKEVDVGARTIFKWTSPTSKVYKPEFAENFIAARREASSKHNEKATRAAYDASNDLIEGLTKEGKPYFKGNQTAVGRSKLIMDQENRNAIYEDPSRNPTQMVKHQGDEAQPIIVKSIDYFPEPGEKKPEGGITQDRISKEN